MDGRRSKMRESAARLSVCPVEATPITFGAGVTRRIVGHQIVIRLGAEPIDIARRSHKKEFLIGSRH